MMSRSAQPQLIVLALILVLGFLVAACSDSGAETEAAATSTTNPEEPAQNPPLVSFDVATRGFQDFSQGTEKSFGIFVCVTAENVTIESVEAISQEGDIEVIGAVLYESSDAFVGAIDDFPPRGLSDDFLTDIPGAVVSTACDSETRSQIVVGTSRTGPGGGIIEGIRIIHDDGSLDVSRYNIILCGDNGQFCEDVDSRAADPGSAHA